MSGNAFQNSQHARQGHTRDFWGEQLCLKSNFTHRTQFLSYCCFYMDLWKDTFTSEKPLPHFDTSAICSNTAAWRGQPFERTAGSSLHSIFILICHSLVPFLSTTIPMAEKSPQQWEICFNSFLKKFKPACVVLWEKALGIRLQNRAGKIAICNCYWSYSTWASTRATDTCLYRLSYGLGSLTSSPTSSLSS